MLNFGRLSIKFLLHRKYNFGSIIKPTRFYSSKLPVPVKEIRTFQEIINDRRSEAKRSIVVQVSSEKSFNELYKYCLQFGEIINAHHYKISNENYHYILIEYENEIDANNAIDSSCYNEDLSGVPVRSPFLWFKAGKNSKIKQINSSNSKFQLKTIDGIHDINENELKNLLQYSESLEDQIKILYHTTCLNDLGIRLRFLAATQIEQSISGMFPRANAQPFGSSVNGFGKLKCDLDLILRLDEENHQNPINSRLVFHTKENLTNGRSQIQRQMESIGDILQLFLPGICSVRRILQARVPIIKFHHEHLDLEVDLSMNNLSGLYMSELLHMLGEIDERVRPLTFCIRHWAKCVGLTNPSPGRWITNFSLTCLIIYFLQQLKQPILPTINYLNKLATSNDIRITEDGINCTFLRDLKKLQFHTNNHITLNELLLQFYEFYSKFDFNNRAISLNDGHSVIKPDHSAMYIINPLEQLLNVSKNVSFEECERFRIEVRNAAWILESEIENNSLIKNNNKDEQQIPWGLLNLFKTPEKTIIYPQMFFKPRMVDVSELFDEKDKENSNNFNTKNNSSSSSNNEHQQQQQKIDYKNPQIRNQIENIKNKRKSDLKQIRIDKLLPGKTKLSRR